MKFENSEFKEIKKGEVVEKPYREEDEDEDEDNNPYFKKIEIGKIELKLKEISLEEYRKYFETIKSCDMPIGNGLLSLNFLMSLYEKGKIENFSENIKSVIEEWEGINSKYQKIDTENLNEEVGKSIIIKMKKLINELIKELRAWQDSDEKNEKIPERLKNTYEDIRSCSKEYVALPAYIAYRAVGIYEVNSQRLKKRK